MGLLASVALVALGAILLWGVDGSLGGVELATIGVILIVIGAIGFFLSALVRSRSARATASPDDDEKQLTSLPR